MTNPYASILGIQLPTAGPAQEPRERNERTLELRRLMDKHQLSIAHVAVLLGRRPQTVAVWRVGGTKPIPQRMLELLKSKLDEVQE